MSRKRIYLCDQCPGLILRGTVKRDEHTRMHKRLMPPSAKDRTPVRPVWYNDSAPGDARQEENQE